MLLMDLPSEVILEILSSIKIQADLRAVSRTCKKLRSYNQVFQWQRLLVIIAPSSTSWADLKRQKSDTSFNIVAGNAPGRLLEGCDQGRIPCENVEQVMIKSLGYPEDLSDIQSDYNKMLAKFPRLKILGLGMPTFPLELPSDLPLRTIRADFTYYLASRKRGVPESSNIMVFLATLARLPHLKTLQISGRSSGIEHHRLVTEYCANKGERRSTVEVLHISLSTFMNKATLLNLLACPNALKHLTLQIPYLYELDISALFAAIARHSHSLKTLLISRTFPDFPSILVNDDSTESDLCKQDFSTFASLCSLAVDLPRDLDPNISHRLPPHLKHLQYDCNLDARVIELPWLVSLADEKRGKLPCLETITCWRYGGGLFESINRQTLQKTNMMAEIGAALGEKGVVFTFSETSHSRYAAGSEAVELWLGG